MPQHFPRALSTTLLALSVGCSAPAPQGTARIANEPRRAADYLYIWSGDRDKKESDFLAVVDVRPGSDSFAQILSTVPVPARGTSPHHTEHQVEADGLLFANGFGAGRTFRFDVKDARAPELLGEFGAVGEFSFPHSFVQLTNGNLLATFQGRGPNRTPPGGLVELDREGRLVRATTARAAGFDSLQLRPYSLTVLPAIDRVVSTSTDMIGDFGANVQVWRLSDLTLLSTTDLSQASKPTVHHTTADSAHGMAHHFLPGEPRVLADGKTVLLATFTCGFYRVTNLDARRPTVEFVRAFSGMDCAVPVLVGNFWIQTVPDEHALVALDVSDAQRPREVGRVTFDSTFRPHWLAYDDGGSRLIVNDQKQRMFLVNFIPSSGAMAIDTAFHDRGASMAGVSFRRPSWPHGASGDAVPHGSVFSRRK